MRSITDLTVIITFLVASLIFKVASYIPGIVILINNNVCYSLAWNIVQASLFGSNAFITGAYLLYLCIIPEDMYKSYYVSKILAFIGIPSIILDAIIAALAIPGCLYNIPAITLASYIGGVAASSMSIVYHTGVGVYSIFRWSRGL